MSAAALFCTLQISAQATQDTLKSKEIEAVTLTVKKPTVENKIDRTVFNVANSSILSGNTTWDVLRMTPLVSIDNNDNVKSEGETVTVYINDRKTVFTGKELKEYLKSIPADNLMKIEVITNPSSRYETTGQVINIVLKKRDDEGIKGSATFTNSQNTKNSQYVNTNVNYHKKNFTQSITASYSDNTQVYSSKNINTYYADSEINRNTNQTKTRSKSPSFASSSELELNEKNNIGLILEYFQYGNQSESNSENNIYRNDSLKSAFLQDQFQNSKNHTLNSNIFYKYYDKVKNKIFDVNLGVNYGPQNENTQTFRDDILQNSRSGIQILDKTQTRNYYLKLDYSQPLDSLSNLEVGAKFDFNNNVIPYDYFTLTDGNWMQDSSGKNTFHYYDNLNSIYANISRTFFKKLETRVGLRYEYMTFKLRQDGSEFEKKVSYGTILPNVLVKYIFSPNYNVSLGYNYSLWRPWYSEFNPYIMPVSNGNYYQGNMDLEPNPNHRFNFKLGVYKKYFLSVNYGFTNQDYWSTYVKDGDYLITKPDNFKGKSERINFNLSTNQNFFKNKLTVNVNLGLNYIDNSDFNTRNDLKAKNYITNFGGSANLSYTNLFNKNINASVWMGLQSQNYGNTTGNNYNFFNNISITKIFKQQEMEVSVQLNNIFKRPIFDQTTYSPIGTFRTEFRSDWHGFSISFIKRFGNQKVKENTKKDVEKNQGGAK